MTYFTLKKILIFLILCMGVILIVFLSFTMKRQQSQRIVYNEMRKPGFLFVELETREIDQYIQFFNKVADFELIRKNIGFALMQSSGGQLLLMNPDDLPNHHPFYGKVQGKTQGIGVEIGIVVKNLNQSFQSALQMTSFKNSGWQISSNIIYRPWGVQDFRVLAPDGYYLRFTEAPQS